MAVTWLRQFLGFQKKTQPVDAALVASQVPAPAGVQHVINNPHGAGTVPAALLPGTGRGYFVPVVGETHHAAALQELRVSSHGEQEQSVILSPEPENTYDPHAVAVTTFRGETIGYLRREDAPRYQPTLLALRSQGLTSICSARFYWPTQGKPNIGVWLDLEVPTAVAAKFGVKYQRVTREGD